MQHERYGIFYLLPSDNLNDIEFSFKEKLVCFLTKKQWRLGKRVLITCEDKVQANRIDEALWRFDQNSFLPHDLFGKNIDNIPIVICWSECHYVNSTRDLLINLMKKHMSFFFNFKEIIDFVPTDSVLKQWARFRYKSYKEIGFNLNVFDSSCIVKD